MSVIFSSLYLFLVLPNLHDFPMLVLAFAVPFICIGTLTVQPRFYLGTLLTIVNTSTFISIQGAYDADFFTFLNSNLAGPVGLLFAFIWTLVMRPFGVELAAKRMTRFAWRDIVEMTEPATLAEHRQVGVQMLDRLMQHLPRLSQTGQDSGVALRDLRVGLNLLDLLAYLPRGPAGPRAPADGGRGSRRPLRRLPARRRAPACPGAAAQHGARAPGAEPGRAVRARRCPHPPAACPERPAPGAAAGGGGDARTH
jgi:uncharacterized membrane protein YccC